jgi:hypothetical protein
MRRRGINQAAGAVAVAATLLGVSFVPIYGSGENLAAGNKLRYTAWDVYRDTFADVRASRR